MEDNEVSINWELTPIERYNMIRNMPWSEAKRCKMSPEYFFVKYLTIKGYTEEDKLRMITDWRWTTVIDYFKSLEK